MSRRPLAMFLLCFGVVALSGALIVEVGHAWGDFDHFYFAGVQTLYVGTAVFLIEAVVLGVVAAWRRSLAETLAGYAAWSSAPCRSTPSPTTTSRPYAGGASARPLRTPGGSSPTRSRA